MSVDALIATAREMDPGRGDPWPTELFASNVRMRAEEYEEWATALHQTPIRVCERRSPWWTVKGDVWRYPEEVVEERDGLFRVAQAHYVENQYQVSWWQERWQVETFGAGGSTECDPGDEVAVPTFTTPPDLSLLTEATPEMVIGPDGEPVE